MKIAVIASKELKKEIMSRNQDLQTEFNWHSSLSGLVEDQDADVFFDLEFDGEPERIDILSRLLPQPVFVHSVVLTLAEIRQPFIRINAWPGFIQRPVVEIALADQSQEEKVREIFLQMGWDHEIVPDTAGMISGRIIAMIINEAYHAYHEKISTKEEIDTAMKLGTGYPLGPFEWSCKIGLRNIYELLSALGKKDPRYTISEALEKEL